MLNLPQLAAAGATGNDKTVYVVIETPRGCRNKFKYDLTLGCMKLTKVLPAGFAFPYDFGFFPGTKAKDGDPLDVLVLMDEPAFPGCVVEVRIVGVLEAEQTEKRKTVRNDRLVAVASEAHDYQHVQTIRDLNRHLLQELEHFFISYVETSGKKLKFLGVRGPKRAEQLWRDSRHE